MDENEVRGNAAFDLMQPTARINKGDVHHAEIHAQYCKELVKP
jgi:hypothetical protein